MNETASRGSAGIRRVAVIAGGRTAFVKAGTAFKEKRPLDLAVHAVRSLLERSRVDAGLVQSIAFGVVVPEPGRPNLAREIVFEAELPGAIEAQTISSYCITGLRTVTAIAEAIACGRIDCGIAGGVEVLSRADKDTFREPTTRLSMGEHMEITRKAWSVPRALQDEIALASHRNAVRGRANLAQEIYPLDGAAQDSGPRGDTSLEALAALKPVFAADGTVTAGNASPVTDGASAVLLMSAERARAEGRTPLAYIRAAEYGAIAIEDGLLMAPGIVVPRLLERTGIALAQIDRIEIHEAFAAQVIANVWAWERGWKAQPTGSIDWSRINTNGGSIALGHPWSATGGRLVTTLANELARGGHRFGLISACAAGAMAGALLLERDAK
ncbi:MAG: thiolase family protein [Planctomycetes bacterium]|nr:thiolase family protein [Planctomycetota bacterium]